MSQHWLPEIKVVAVDKLVPYARNSKLHPKEQVDKIARQISEHGFTQPILADRDLVVVAGHGRLEAAKVLGMQQVPVIVAEHLTEDQARAIRIADNKVAESGWDMPMLAFELGTLDRAEIDLTLTGFDMGEARSILSEFGCLGTENPNDESGSSEKYDEVPTPPVEPKSKRGEVYRLGRHRLMCGDSTKIEDVEALLAGDKADMMFTDPPYGVSYVGGVSHSPEYAEKREAQGMKIENDALSDEDLLKLVDNALSNALEMSKPGAVWYVAAPPGPLHHIFATVLRRLEVWRQTINWVKSAFVFGRSDYHYRHEPIFYGWKKGAAHFYCEDRTQDTIWEFPRPKAADNPGHPTAKPLDLVKRAITNSSREGELVVDLFGGSGTTLIAAELSGRRAALMELDPKYIDVIIARWEQHTGQKAELCGAP